METKKSERVNFESWKPSFFKFGIIISLTLVLSAFEWNTPIGSSEKLSLIDGVIIDVDKVLPTNVPEPPKELPLPKAPITSIINVIEEGEGTDINIAGIEDGNLGIITYVEPPIEFDEPELVPIHIAEIMPVFPGGEAEMFNHLQRSTKYPRESLTTSTQGTVFVAFIIERDGSLSNIHVARSVEHHLDNEALRVVSQMPRWKPGYQGGKAVRVHMVLPIRFILK
jgi:protein TonB